VAKASISEFWIMYGLKPVPFKDGASVASRVGVDRVRDCSCSPARGGRIRARLKSDPDTKPAPLLLLGLAWTEHAIAHAHQRGWTFKGNQKLDRFVVVRALRDLAEMGGLLGQVDIQRFEQQGFAFQV
jgi:hypothetical protein